MSVKGAYRDWLTLGLAIGIPIALIMTVWSYLTTHDERTLYFGIVAIAFMVFGVIARYRFVVDYIWTLFKKWR